MLVYLLLAVLAPPATSLTTSTTKPFAVNLKLKVKPDRRAEFLDLVRNNQRLTLETEPLSLQYVVGEDVDEQNTFYIHEQFVSEQGFAEHKQTAHNADWGAFKLTEPFTESVCDFYFLDGETVEAPVRDAFCVHAELCPRPEMREEFLEVIRNNRKGSRLESLCLQYAFGESNVEENKFLFHEEFAGADGGKEGFDAHAVAPHFLAWEKFASANPFARPPVVSFYRTI